MKKQKIKEKLSAIRERKRVIEMIKNSPLELGEYFYSVTYYSYDCGAYGVTLQGYFMNTETAHLCLELGLTPKFENGFLVSSFEDNKISVRIVLTGK